MKKFTKLTLTLAMLFGILGGAKARDVYATLANGVANGSATWTNEGDNYTFTWTNSSDDYVSLFEAFGGTIGNELDWSEGTNIHLQRGALSNGPFYITIVANGKSFKRGMWSGNNPVDLTLTATSGDGFTLNGWGGSFGYITANDLAHVTDIRVEGNTANAGSIVLSNVYAQIVPRTTLTFGSNGVATIPLSKIDVSGALTYNATTGELTATGAGEVVIMFDKAYDFVNVNGWTVTGTGTDIFNNWQLKGALNGDKSELNMYSGWLGRDIAALKDGRDLSAITGVKLYVTEKTGTYTFSELKFTATPMSVVDARDVPIATLPHYSIAADGSVSQTYTIATNYGSSEEIVLGDGDSKMNDYVDIADYDELRIYTSDNGRVFFINAETITSGTSTTDGATAYLNKSPFSHNSLEGYYYAKVSDIKEAYNGHAKVIGVKGETYGAKLTVSKIQVYKNSPSYSFILSGQYSSNTDISAVTSDASATAIDCSNLSGNDISITTLNSNCLFYAGNGVLSNTNNVIVSGVCANLELTDGHPFKAPADFIATPTAYTGRSFTVAQATTVCLPFDLTSDEAASLGKFYEYSSFDGSTLHFSLVAAPVANKPYFVIPEATSLTLSGADKTIFATPAALKVTANDVDFIGTMEATTIPASGGDYSYYAYNNGDFVKITTAAATLPAFRAYFKVLNSAISSDAPALNICFDEFETTGIKDVKNAAKSMNGYYNLNGQKVAQPTKGLYIVNGKKVVIK